MTRSAMIFALAALQPAAALASCRLASRRAIVLQPSFSSPVVASSSTMLPRLPPAVAASTVVRSSPTSMLLGRLFGAAPDEPIFRLRTSLRTLGWLSWWVQLSLSTVSGVLLLFANSVTTVPSAITLIGRLFALGGLAAAIASALWTFSYRNLANSLGSDRAPTPAGKAAEKAAGLVRVGIALNVIGTALCLVGAEAIVGSLAAKALTQSTTATAGVFGTVAAAPAVQPLDILIVQANTNLVFSHFLSLCVGMRLRGAAESCASSADAALA